MKRSKLLNPQKSNKKKFLVLIITATFVFSTLLLSAWILVKLYDQQKDLTKKIANIKSFEGDVLVLQNQSKKRIRAFNGLSLKKFDRLYVAENSNVQIIFETGDELKFNENSEINLRYWDNTKNVLPIFVYLRRGSYQILKNGKKNQLLVESDKNLHHQFEKTPFTPSLNSDKYRDELSIDLVTPQDPKKSLPLGVSLKPTNREITTNVKSYLQHFQKCQLNALGSELTAKGQITIGFSILPDGKVDKIKILDSTTSSQQLDACVKTVFERMTFNKFEGDPIQVNYPLRFD
ncbi:MAG: AgmX/PglI C-terminal domain-containing protein [Bdellovibrionales bacterium]|nr:AgmX/PglI C-terminal domain-containing protein [Bdellovibrionales bacterium]